MKNKGLIITFIVILSLLCILLILFMIGMLNKNVPFGTYRFLHRTSNELALDEVYEDNYSSIRIDSDAAEISIRYSEDDKVRLVIYGEKENVSVRDASNELKIQTQSNPCLFFCFDFRSSKIELFLPKEYDQKIEINNNYGNIEIDDFSNSTLIIEEDCGDVKIRGGREVKVSNNLGDIIVEKAFRVEIDEDAGNVKVGEIEDAIIKNSLGDIEVNTVNNSLDIQNDCGDIEIQNLNLKMDSYIKSSLGDIKIGNTNEIYMDAHVSLGDVRIRNNYHKSDITLKITNDCGDIKVNN